MKPTRTAQQTTVGRIGNEALRYTAGTDRLLDVRLIEADCIGSAAHVTMLAGLPLRPKLFSVRQKDRVIAELVRIMRRARAGAFIITLRDQDVHLAVERELTRRLGVSGRNIHVARSRNDQVAVDLRLYLRAELLDTMDEALDLAGALLRLARRHRAVPMVGRTHMQPAMPSSVGLWASAYTESLRDDLRVVRCAYALADECPLGSAAGYGVPLPIDRQRVSDLLGFARPVHNVLHASNTRGKLESLVLAALSQVMLSLSRLAADLLLYSMPEFAYFELPPDLCTGSSIMPQKRNPDVLELVRARAARVLAHAAVVADIVKGLPGGYNRDVQETKEPLMAGLDETRAALRVLASLTRGLRVNPDALRRGFTPGVFATDRALELVARGVPFRDAYHQVKARLGDLSAVDPSAALALKRHAGAPMGLDFGGLARALAADRASVASARRRIGRAISALLHVRYPLASGSGYGLRD